MKRLYPINLEREKRESIKNRKEKNREAHHRKHKQRLKSRKRRVRTFIENVIATRNEFIKDYYKKRWYQPKRKTIHIEHEFGIEYPHLLHNFFSYASAILESKAKFLTLNLKKCTRIWPSAITLLCALAQWSELVTTKDSRQIISQKPSKHHDVNSYLDHCGFYDYVKIQRPLISNNYPANEIVKIQREEKKTNTKVRENEIMRLLKDFTYLNSDELEAFDDRIATEIFNNVTEHGISHKDAGWWVLAQYHKIHGILSICIADNGIGIKNSLLTGPQRERVKRELAHSHHNEGVYIQKAMQKNISGAFTASEPKEAIFRGELYDRGERRGKGLSRIRDNCKALGIRLAILSNRGYYILDEHGDEEAVGGHSNPIFAGTMYHLTIRTERGANVTYKYS